MNEAEIRKQLEKSKILNNQMSQLIAKLEQLKVKHERSYEKLTGVESEFDKAIMLENVTQEQVAQAVEAARKDFPDTAWVFIGTIDNPPKN